MVTRAACVYVLYIICTTCRMAEIIRSILALREEWSPQFSSKIYCGYRGRYSMQLLGGRVYLKLTW